MKKLLAIFLAGIAVFSLSACGNNDNSGDGGKTEPESNVTQPITDGGKTDPESNVVQPITDGGSFDGSNYH